MGSRGLTRSQGAGAQDDRKLKSRAENLTPVESQGAALKGGAVLGTLLWQDPPQLTGPHTRGAAGDQGGWGAAGRSTRRCDPPPPGAGVRGEARVITAFLSPTPGMRAPATLLSHRPTRLCPDSSKALPLEVQLWALWAPGRAEKASG